jgi:hypothetical protein
MTNTHDQSYEVMYQEQKALADKHRAEAERLQSKHVGLLIALGAIAVDYPDDAVVRRIQVAVVGGGSGALAAIDQSLSNLRAIKSLNDDPHIEELIDVTADILFAVLYPEQAEAADVRPE